MWDRPPGLSCWRAPENRTVRVRYKIKEKAGRKVTLEENIQQLRDSLVVTSAQTLRHETRVKEHQQWLDHKCRASSEQQQTESWRAAWKG